MAWFARPSWKRHLCGTRWSRRGVPTRAPLGCCWSPMRKSKSREFDRALRDAIVDEAVGALPVAMTVEQFQELVAATPADAALWERQGRLRPVMVAGRRYVFPGLLRALLLERGVLRCPRSTSRPAFARGPGIVRPVVSGPALEVFVFEAGRAGVSVDEYTAEVLERYALDGRVKEPAVGILHNLAVRRWFSWRR